MMLFKNEVALGAGALQFPARQDAGVEAASRYTRYIFR